MSRERRRGLEAHVRTGGVGAEVVGSGGVAVPAGGVGGTEATSLDEGAGAVVEVALDGFLGQVGVDGGVDVA